MNQVNRELQELRAAIAHYERILREDELINAKEIPSDGRPKLSSENIKDINSKLLGLKEKRDDLLSCEEDYVEVIN